MGDYYEYYVFCDLKKNLKNVYCPIIRVFKNLNIRSSKGVLVSFS